MYRKRIYVHITDKKITPKIVISANFGVIFPCKGAQELLCECGQFFRLLPES